jgi:predicted nucleotidyltransferase
MDKSEAINIVKEYKSLLIKKHFVFENIYLFGSYAKNTNREDSDIDVAIVVNKLPDDYFKITPLIWKLRRMIDDRIEPVIIEKNNDFSGLLKDIQTSGIEIKD